MQTIEQLLAKIINLRADSLKKGAPMPDIVCMSPEDELVLMCHEWQKVDLAKAPPNVRKTIKSIGGLTVEWDSTDTEVRAETADEKQARQSRKAHELSQMVAANQQISASREPRRKVWW